jgi:hypothetical protein
MIGLGFGNFQSGVGGFVGLLDTYPNAAAAYSVRRLSSTYNDALMQVRIDTVGQPVYDIGFDANGDLDTADLISKAAGNDAFVRTWYDQSGNGNDATQTTTSSQPQIVNEGVIITQNSKPTIDFSINNFVALIETTISLPQPYTATTVQYYNFNSRDKYIFGQKPGSRYRSNIGKSNGTGRYFIHGGSNSGAVGDLLISRQYLTFALFNGADTELSINSNNTQGLSAGTDPKDGLTIGNFKSPSGFSYQWEDNIREIVFWGSDQSANRSGIEANQNNFYSIY